MLLADVNALHEAIAWRRLFAPGLALELRLPQIPQSRHRELQSAIERQSEACGCTEGAVGAAAFLTMYLIAQWLNLLRPESTLSAAAVGIGAAVVGTLVGKAVGLVRARLSLRHTLLEAVNEVQTVSRD